MKNSSGYRTVISVQVYVVGSPGDMESSCDRPFMIRRNAVDGLFIDVWNHEG